MTSSALRAPPLILLGKYVPAPGVPWVATLSLVGLGLAGAIAPYLTLALRGSDPRLPFALASLALVAAVGGMVWAERRLVAAAPAAPAPPARPLDARVIAFFLRPWRCLDSASRSTSHSIRRRSTCALPSPPNSTS